MTTATAERKAAKKESAAVEPAGFILVDYNPELAPEGQYTHSLFSLPITIGDKFARDDKFAGFRPGIQRVPADTWEKWHTSQAADVVAAIAEDVLRVVSEHADIRKMTSQKARAIIRRCIDVALLSEWSGLFSELEPATKEALIMREENLKTKAMPQKRQFLFGQQVA